MGLKSIALLAGTAFAGLRTFQYYYRNRKLFENQIAVARKILAAQKHYYQTLPEAEKEEFERRVVWFMREKEYHSRCGSLPVTVEMKVLIAACAVQLTFGLKPLVLEHFSKILIYPDVYRSTITSLYHQGEVNLAGLLVLSWKHFQEGYRNPTNGRNLGLHEMAHALYFENSIRNKEFGFFDARHLNAWEQVVSLRLNCSETANHTFFRRYGLANEHEFFAVSVEYFFEQPAELQQHLPDVYQTLANLLRQDPASVVKV